MLVAGVLARRLVNDGAAQQPLNDLVPDLSGVDNVVIHADLITDGIAILRVLLGLRLLSTGRATLIGRSLSAGACAARTPAAARGFGLAAPLRTLPGRSFGPRRTLTIRLPLNGRRMTRVRILGRRILAPST